MNITTIGLVAAFLTTVAAVPQVARCWRTRHVRDISLWQPVILVAGMVLWLWYGLQLGDLPLIIGNIVSLALNMTLIYLKLRFAVNDPPAEPCPIHTITEEP
jgi:MtN3 and saliva related transmembrane protein